MGGPRDADLLELEIHNRATWDVLEAATRQRDAALRYHGALVALLPVLLGRLTGGQLLAVAGAAAAFLAFVSVVTLRAVQGLRLLQFHISAAERWSRHRLAAGGPEPYFGYVRDHALPPLPRQQDPMGFVVASARLVVLFDAFLLAVTGVVALDFALVGDDVREVGIRASLAAGAALGLFVTALTRAVVDRWLRRGERQVSIDVRTRLAAIDVDG